MKLLKTIGLALAALILLVFIMILALSDEVHMSKSVVIDATPGEVYRELISFKNFTEWSPWAAKDTATVYTYEGPTMGVGTKLSWTSESDQVGSGSMEMIEVKENELTKVLMKFDGFDSSPTASYIIEPVEDGTQLTWTYDETEVSGIGKIFGLMMDTFLGPDYEIGLANFKDRLESAPETSSDITLTTVNSFEYIGITKTIDPALIDAVMAQCYGDLFNYIGINGIIAGGDPIAVYSEYSPESTTFTCGLPIGGPAEGLPVTIEKLTMPTFQCVKYLYRGDYANMMSAYEELEAYIQFANYEITGKTWEQYVTDPEIDPDTANWITYIYYPVK